MDRSKRKAADSKKKEEKGDFEDISPVENETTREEQESNAGTNDDMDTQPLKDRHGAPINIRPKGMDA